MTRVRLQQADMDMNVKTTFTEAGERYAFIASLDGCIYLFTNSELDRDSLSIGYAGLNDMTIIDNNPEQNFVMLFKAVGVGDAPLSDEDIRAAKAEVAWEFQRDNHDIDAAEVGRIVDRAYERGLGGEVEVVEVLNI